jgi:hypothetical protein
MVDQRFLQDGFDKCLSHAIEECGEFLAAAGKTQRWGPYSVNPLVPTDQQERNIVWLLREMGDLAQSLARLHKEIGGVMLQGPASAAAVAREEG